LSKFERGEPEEDVTEEIPGLSDRFAVVD